LRRLVRKIRAGVVSIVLGLGPFVLPVGLVRTSLAQNGAPVDASKNQPNSRKAYLKHQKKEQKKIKNAEKKAQKKNRELHPTVS
jgi:hypothetical protein